MRWAAGVLGPRATLGLRRAAWLAGRSSGALALVARPRARPARSRPPSPPPAASAGAARKAPRVSWRLHIHVRGTAELHAVATADHGELTLHGELIDDAGTPVPGAHITVQAAGADDPRAAPRVGPLRPCDDAGGHTAARTGPDDGAVETDDRGGFCAVGRAPDGKLALKLRFRGSKLYDAVELSVPVEAAEAHLVRTILRFEPPPETLDLDHESITVTAKLSVDRSEAARQGPAGSAQRASLALTLTDERGARVAEAMTGGDGRARFEVKTTALGGPGSGELTVRFAGNAVLAKAEWAQPVVRRADARLALAHPIERADAEDGVPIDVDVTAGRGPVSGGVVEVQRLAIIPRGPAAVRAVRRTPIHCSSWPSRPLHCARSLNHRSMTPNRPRPCEPRLYHPPNMHFPLRRCGQRPNHRTMRQKCRPFRDMSPPQHHRSAARPPPQGCGPRQPPEQARPRPERALQRPPAREPSPLAPAQRSPRELAPPLPEREHI